MVTLARSDSAVVAVRKRWPKVIRLLVVTPNVTRASRAPKLFTIHSAPLFSWRDSLLGTSPSHNGGSLHAVQRRSAVKMKRGPVGRLNASQLMVHSA